MARTPSPMPFSERALPTTSTPGGSAAATSPGRPNPGSGTSDRPGGPKTSGIPWSGRPLVIAQDRKASRSFPKMSGNLRGSSELVL